MNETFINKVDYNLAHDEFYNFIESFPNAKVYETNNQKKLRTMDTLRKQVYNHNDEVEQKLCYRFCFKLDEKKIIDYCLNSKCNQSDFNLAANKLGYLK